MDISSEQIRSMLISLFVLLISVALHEFGHAVVADKLGDDTPRRQGRVTLNPLAHADPIGTFLLPLLSGLGGAMGRFSGGFGWGKPVQWQPHRVARRWSASTAKILVAFAGPAMNLLLGVVAALVHVALVAQHVIAYESGVGKVLQVAVFSNFALFFFNLLPVPPLDGGHIAESFTPHRYRSQFEQFARFAPFIVLGFMVIPQVQHVVLWPATQVAIRVYEGFGRLFGIF